MFMNLEGFMISQRFMKDESVELYALFVWTHA